MKHCPECQAEYQDRVTRCVHCDVELVPGPPEERAGDERPDTELEAVYATSNPALVALVKSLLDEAGIAYFTKGDLVQDLIGLGRVGGSNVAIGPVEFVVAGDDAPAAREILSHIEDEAPEDPPEDEPDV